MKMPRLLTLCLALAATLTACDTVKVTTPDGTVTESKTVSPYVGQGLTTAAAIAARQGASK